MKGTRAWLASGSAPGTAATPPTWATSRARTDSALASGVLSAVADGVAAGLPLLLALQQQTLVAEPEARQFAQEIGGAVAGGATVERALYLQSPTVPRHLAAAVGAYEKAGRIVDGLRYAANVLETHRRESLRVRRDLLPVLTVLAIVVPALILTAHLIASPSGGVLLRQPGATALLTGSALLTLVAAAALLGVAVSRYIPVRAAASRVVNALPLVGKIARRYGLWQAATITAVALQSGSTLSTALRSAAPCTPPSARQTVTTTALALDSRTHRTDTSDSAGELLDAVLAAAASRPAETLLQFAKEQKSAAERGITNVLLWARPAAITLTAALTLTWAVCAVLVAL